MKEFVLRYRTLIALIVLACSSLYLLIELLHYDNSAYSSNPETGWLNPLKIIFLGGDTIGSENRQITLSMTGRLNLLKQLALFLIFVKLINDILKEKISDFFFGFLMFFFMLEVGYAFYAQFDAFKYSGFDDWRYSYFFWKSLYALVFATLAWLLIQWNEKGRYSSFTITDKRNEVKYIISKAFPTDIKPLRYFHYLAEMNLFRLFSFSIIMVVLMSSLSRYNSERYDSIWVYIDGLFVLLIVAVSNMLFEKKFGVSWAKIITGSRAVDRGTLTLMSWSKAIGRAFSRLIPFDLISFLTKDGWHDSVSKTDVVFLNEKKSVAGFNAFTEKLFLFLIIGMIWCCAAWFGVKWIGSSRNALDEVLTLPLFLSISALILCHLLSCVWFSVNNSILELMNKGYCLDNSILISSYFVWILPVFGFGIAKDTINKMKTHIADLVETPSAGTEFNKTSSYFLQWLLIFQLYLILGFGVAVFILRREAHLIMVLVGLFFLAFIVAIAFYRMSKKLSELLKILDFKVEAEQNN